MTQRFCSLRFPPQGRTKFHMQIVGKPYTVNAQPEAKPPNSALTGPCLKAGIWSQIRKANGDAQQYIYVCLYFYSYVYTNRHTYIYIYIWTYISIYIYIYLHVYTWIYTGISIDVGEYLDMCLYCYCISAIYRYI